MNVCRCRLVSENQKFFITVQCLLLSLLCMCIVSIILQVSTLFSLLYFMQPK